MSRAEHGPEGATELLALAERAESATGADRTLDALISAAVGLPWAAVGIACPRLTASLDAVLALVAEKGLSPPDVLRSALSQITDKSADAGTIARYALAELLRTLTVPL